MMHLLPCYLPNEQKIYSIARSSKLKRAEVISALWICLQDHTRMFKTPDEIFKTVRNELYRKNHYDIKIARNRATDYEEGAEHLSLFDLAHKDRINFQTPLNLLIKYEQKQQVDDFVNANFGGSKDAALATFGDTKALSELLSVTRRRAQQIITKRREENDQIDLFGSSNSDVEGDE